MSSPSGFSDLSLALIEQTGQAFFAYAVDTASFVYLNPDFKASFKVPEDRTQPQDLWEMVHPEDQAYVQEKLQLILNKGVKTSLEFRIHLPEQEEQWVCVTVSQLVELDRKVIVGHAKDITDKRQYNDHLKRYSNKKNSVLNILAHDLAGPLGMIHNLSGLLSEQLKSGEEDDTHEMLDLIGRISKQGSVMLQEFMNQEFLESSMTDVVTRRVDLVQKMGEMLEEYKLIGGELRTQTVNFSYSKPKIYAEVDDLKLMQAITNLISNSLKFTHEDGIINISLKEEENSVSIEVADNGVGIPERYHQYLFEKFTPARRPGLMGEKSVGLGMSIVKTIIDWHHGEIWFTSAEGQGTTFYIRLPKNQTWLNPKREHSI